MRSNLNEIQILIADDEFSIRDIIDRRLTAAGYKCTVASDGKSALRELGAHQFDLALLDISMPGKTGIDVLRKMRGDHSDTAVIMITAIADVEIAIKSMKLGAYDYIIKPVDLNILATSIDKALDRRKLILENKNYQFHLEEQVEKQTKKIRESFLNSIESLACALEAKDKYTSGHSQRVTEIAVAIAQELELSQNEIEKIQLAGLVHDIGKIGVRESVLNKPGKLTADEYQHIISHCEIGERILEPIVEDKEILKMVRHHHERYDGTGYPDGLSAKQIPQGARILAVAEAFTNMSGDLIEEKDLPQGARILAVADAYDAMTSDRPYRQAMTSETARAELEKGKGKQFDPVIVDAFLKVVDKDATYQSQHYSSVTSG